MGWIQTYSGRQFWPLEPSRAPIDIGDIAHALSLQCRFNGHCRQFYSVAEHSVRVSEAVSGEWALWGLLHDAAEAYLGDLPRPLKQRLAVFEEYEQRLLRHIVSQFGLSWPMPAAVAEADDVLLATEARDLMAVPPVGWGLRARPLAEVIEPLAAEVARERFLRRFELLVGGR